MTLQKIYEMLSEAEQYAFQLITDAQPTDMSETVNYGQVGDYLSVARMIGQVRQRILELPEYCEHENAAKKASRSSLAVIDMDDLPDMPGAVATEEALGPRDGHDVEFPVYFVADNKLVKVGESREGGKLYKKLVKLPDVEQIISALVSRAVENRAITIEGVSKELGFPQYKAQIAIMALIECGQLKQTGKGQYRYAASGNPSSKKWMTLLERLPERSDLLGYL